MLSWKVHFVKMIVILRKWKTIQRRCKLLVLQTFTHCLSQFPIRHILLVFIFKYKMIRDWKWYYYITSILYKNSFCFAEHFYTCYQWISRFLINVYYIHFYYGLLFCISDKSVYSTNIFKIQIVLFMHRSNLRFHWEIHSNRVMRTVTSDFWWRSISKLPKRRLSIRQELQLQAKQSDELAPPLCRSHFEDFQPSVWLATCKQCA